MIKNNSKTNDSKIKIAKKESKIINAVIEDKKTSDVKEKVIKKQVDNKKAFLSLGLLILVVLILFYFLFFYSPYKYSFTINNVPYYSNYYTPSSFFNTIKNEKIVFVSPLLEEENISPIMVNSMQLWNVVLNANNVNVVQLIRVTKNGELSYCQTNDGNVEINKVLSLQECNVLLNNNNWVVFIDEGKTSVIIEENKVKVFSPRIESSMVNFSVIKEIFPNAQESLDIINQKIYGIQ
ncbi:MAG: hypothetical protein PHP82_01595 [Candidatus ainarchaeum sp.]|nr:hypothetical protein [Candidatus ainarchaeum sp.]